METNVKTRAISYIRFSSKKQSNGDSLKRQTEATERYAKERGWYLDKSLTFRDLGVSGYSGDHRIKGELGTFLELIKHGKIEKGSVLIVENLDRLSRENIIDAQVQFIDIIKAGITIVTLMDRMEYSLESIKKNPMELNISLSYMARAWEESHNKSIRLAHAWKSKRENIESQKITGKCHSWLKLSKDKKSFEVIQDRAEIIRLIFQMKLAGKGAGRIEKELNAMDIWKPQTNRGVERMPAWRDSYIDKILRDKAVIGEFQPHVKMNGKRKPIGDPIPDYYPQIVDKDLFKRVQVQIANNILEKGFKGGRNDKINNLFGHLAVCSKCGYPIVYIDKGKTTKGGQHLYCDSSRRKLGCKQPKIKYSDVENNVLLFCKGLNASDIVISASDRIKEIALIQAQLDSLSYDINCKKDEMETLVNNASNSKNPAFVKALERKYAVSDLEYKKLLNQKRELTDKLVGVQADFKQTDEELNSINELIDLMKDLEGEERLTLRLNLRNQLRKLIKQIKVDSAEQNLVLFFQSGLSRLIHLNPKDPTRKVIDRTIAPKF